MKDEIGHRMVVVGTTGVGKSTLAEQLSTRFNIPLVELDALYWLPNWQGADDATFLNRVDNATVGDRWIVAGNYSKTRDIVWSRADALIWLDYPLRYNYWRLFWRTLRRSITREDLWGTGNRESLYKQFFTKDSLFVWARESHHRRKVTYEQIIAANVYPNLRVIRFYTPRETDNWLRQLLNDLNASD